MMHFTVFVCGGVCVWGVCVCVCVCVLGYGGCGVGMVGVCVWVWVHMCVELAYDLSGSSWPPGSLSVPWLTRCLF